MADPRQLHVLTGPTAVGKTELALQWAEMHGAEIVSADSLLFYRGMDIGTAKPTREELARVPHHLIDVVPVPEPVNIGDYVKWAQTVVTDITARGKRVLVTGGSGFYIKAFFGPVIDEVEVPASLRQEVARLLEREGLAALVSQLGDLNPDGLAGLDTANPRRVTRALERCLASRRTLGELKAAFAAQPGPFADWRVEGVCLERETEDLHTRVEQRVRVMLAAGLEEEVARLEEEGLRRNPSAARSIGYREVLAVHDGELAREELAAEIVRDTKALVRKQRTWFRQQLPELRTVAAVEARPADLFSS
jgi:tRNA dimethylallyltransferase